jgi:hypothetical protein
MQVGEQEKPSSLAEFFKSLLLEVKSAIAHVQRVLVPHICHKDALSTVYSGCGCQPSLRASTAIDDIFESLGGNSLKIDVVDNMSILMLSEGIATQDRVSP